MNLAKLAAAALAAALGFFDPPGPALGAAFGAELVPLGAASSASLRINFPDITIVKGTR